MGAEEIKMDKPTNHEKLLAEALHNLLIHVGVCNLDTEPNGPELLMFTEDYIKLQESNKIGQVEVKTIRWQCSGCDHLCAVLTDTQIEPNICVQKQSNSVGTKKWPKWRKITQ